MSPIPLEIKALVVHKLAHDPKALSAVSYVWPETIPYIREHRFRNLGFYGVDSLLRFLAVIAGAPAILSAIRSIFFTTPFTLTDAPLPVISQYAKLIALVRTAPNIEELFMECADLAQLDLALAATSCPKLKTLTVQKSHASSLTVLLNVLSSFPHLTTLNLLDLTIFDLHQIAGQIWEVSIFPSDLRPDSCVMWDTHHIEGPKQIPQVTSVCISIEAASNLMFLDLLASPKTPFPHIEEITFADHYLPMCRPQRLPALLDRYKNTLRVLDLQSADFNDQTPVLALPPMLEHFKFSVSTTTVLDSILKTMSCSTGLRNVSIDFRDCSRIGRVPDTVALDKVLVGMRALEQLDLKVWLHMKKTVGDGFPVCLGKQVEGRLRLVWDVEDHDERLSMMMGNRAATIGETWDDE